MVQVLIVGAGPTGLTLANELARQGICFRIVEKMPTPSTLSKAIAVQARTLELFERFPSVTENMLQQGVRLSVGKIHLGQNLSAHVDFNPLHSHYPFVLSLPQYDTENILREHLKQQGCVVEMGVELLSADMPENAPVVAHLQHANGAMETLTVEYLVACDGAHSTLRQQLQLPFEGSTFNDQRFFLADVILNKPLMDQCALQVFLAQGSILAFFPLPDQHVRLIAECPKEETPADFGVPQLQALMQRLVASDLAIQQVFWYAEFRINQRKVNQYQIGRVFLMGDAAHIHSPVGGQGMNTGMQDAINLGWKLAFVLKGLGTKALLATYAEERHRVGAQLLHGTNFATRFVMMKNKWGIALRNFLLSCVTKLDCVQQKIINHIAELAVNYRQSALSQQHVAFSGGIVAGDRWPDAAVEVGQQSLRWYQILSSTKFNLVIFNGTDTFYQLLRQKLAPFHASLYWLGVQGEQNTPSMKVDVLIKDSDSNLRKKLAPQGLPIVYLIRPDLYLAYRAEAKQLDQLVQFLARWLLHDNK